MDDEAVDVADTDAAVDFVIDTVAAIDLFDASLEVMVSDTLIIDALVEAAVELDVSEDVAVALELDVAVDVALALELDVAVDVADALELDVAVEVAVSPEL